MIVRIKTLGVGKDLKMKKIIGIFLVVCFVLSVTAAAASAGTVSAKKVTKDGDGRFMKSHDKGKNIHFFKNKYYCWVWVPAHCTFKMVKMYKYDYRRHCMIVFYKPVKFCIPGHWELKLVKHHRGMFSF